MRLYYRPNTGRPLRVAWALEEIGAPYEAIAVSSEDATGPEHLGRHPLGRVPVLEEDGQVLFESTGLVLHLADQHPESGLIAPLGTYERAQVYQWSIAAMTELEPLAVRFLLEQQSSAADRFSASAAAFGQALEGREFLVGSALSAADIITGGVLSVADYAKLLGELPTLSAYLERLRARPTYQRALQVTESLFRPAA